MKVAVIAAEMEGRATGSPGYERAQDEIATRHVQPRPTMARPREREKYRMAILYMPFD